MQLEFRTRKLQRQYEDHRMAERAYGKQVARRYIQRLDIIQAARDLTELTGMPGLNCHPLKGQREGEWAVTLCGFWRLIFTLQGTRLEIVRIEEVSKHYGD